MEVKDRMLKLCMGRFMVRVFNILVILHIP